jgi:hypothetical protein
MSGLALLALAACGEAKLSSITAAQVDGQAIIDADKRPKSGSAMAAPIRSSAIRR